MAYPQGVNFRATAGYVTDGANEALAPINAFGPTYPTTTAQGNTIGWESSQGNSRDRTTANDRRLAGVNFTSAANNFRFDLPAPGSYNIRAAFGDAGSSGNATAWSLLDNATVLATLSTGTQATANSFKDATGALLTAAAWPSGNTALAATFASTICRFRSDSTANNMIAHAYVEAAAPAGGGGGAATYSYTSAGGFVFSGAATKGRGATRTAAAGLQLGGASAATRKANRSASGGILLAGAAPQSRGRSVAASGGLTLSGAATVLRGLARAASGGLLFAGTSPVSFHSAVQSLVVNPVGGLLLRGSAAVSRATSRVVSGGIQFSGHAVKTAGAAGALLASLLPIFARRRRRN